MGAIWYFEPGYPVKSVNLIIHLSIPETKTT